MKYLVSMDSDPLSLPVWLKVHGRDKDAEGFRNGEVTLTLIRTEKGENNTDRAQCGISSSL